VIHPRPLVSLFLAGAAATLTAGAARPQQAADVRTAGAVASTIGGVVFDSIAMRPLADAVVQLAEVPRSGRVGEVRSLRSDSLGRFRFDRVPAGTYLLGFQHLALDSLGMRATVSRVDVRSTAAIRVALSVPSARSILTSLCGAPALRDSVALLVGNVRDARSDAAIPNSFITIRWGELFITRGGLRRDTPILDVYSNDEGWFTACVPGNVPVQTRAEQGNDASGDVELIVPAHSLLRRDLYIGAVVAEMAPRDTTGRPDETRIITRGSGAVHGMVRSADGRPLPGARVAILSGASEARSDHAGRFQLAGLPHGTHTVEARAIGYLPAQVIVDIVTFREARAEFHLIDVNAVLLDTVRVAAVRQLEAAARAGFERRRRGGNGYFLDESRIDSIRPFTFKDLVRAVPGIRFVRSTRIDESWQEHIEFTFGQSQPCLPAIYLDGARLLDGKTDLDAIINPSSVRRLEVYHRGLTPPAELASSGQCGIIAIWTGGRASPARRP
jgi:hypothetical protein